MKSKVDMVSAGKKLRELRGIRTRSGVSREVGVPYATLQSYEAGRREPSGRTKEKLASYYGVRVEEIFLPSNTAKSSEDVLNCIDW